MWLLCCAIKLWQWFSNSIPKTVESLRSFSGAPPWELSVIGQCLSCKIAGLLRTSLPCNGKWASSIGSTPKGLNSFPVEPSICSQMNPSILSSAHRSHDWHIGIPQQTLQFPKYRMFQDRWDWCAISHYKLWLGSYGSFKMKQFLWGCAKSPPPTSIFSGFRYTESEKYQYLLISPNPNIIMIFRFGKCLGNQFFFVLNPSILLSHLRRGEWLSAI